MKKKDKKRKSNHQAGGPSHHRRLRRKAAKTPLESNPFSNESTNTTFREAEQRDAVDDELECALQSVRLAKSPFENVPPVSIDRAKLEDAMNANATYMEQLDNEVVMGNALRLNKSHNNNKQIDELRLSLASLIQNTDRSDNVDHSQRTFEEPNLSDSENTYIGGSTSVSTSRKKHIVISLPRFERELTSMSEDLYRQKSFVPDDLC